MNSHSGEVSARDARLTEVKDGQDRLTGLRFYPDLELPTRDFAAYVARVPGSVRPVLPAALYRQQLANDEWPVVSGDVVQVSPLVSRIAWENEDGPAYGILRDPYIALTTDIEVGSAYFREANLYLLDTTPHVAGARYRYFLVCFGADSGAPELVIPGTLEPRPAE